MSCSYLLFQTNHDTIWDPNKEIWEDKQKAKQQQQQQQKQQKALKSDNSKKKNSKKGKFQRMMMMTPWTSRGLINWLYELINHVTMTLPGWSSWGREAKEVK